jgi:hypothetical protein
LNTQKFDIVDVKKTVADILRNLATGQGGISDNAPSAQATTHEIGMYISEYIDPTKTTHQIKCSMYILNLIVTKMAKGERSMFKTLAEKGTFTPPENFGQDDSDPIGNFLHKIWKLAAHGSGIYSMGVGVDLDAWCVKNYRDLSTLPRSVYKKTRFKKKKLNH